MDRLSWYIAMMSATGIAGAALIVFFTLDWYTWQAIVNAVVIGAIAGWPSAKLISQYIKRNDPLFNPPKKDGVLPDPSAPEV